MSNNLKKMEKDLRAFAKRSKDVKYTKGLLFSFLLMGMLTFSDTLTSPEVKSTENAINQTRKELNTSINDLHVAFKQAKRDNNRLLKRANLELIQLMEQGDHVVKSPWSSWQMGMNYFYSDWRGTYKGRGDKAEKYPYEGIFQRDEDEFNRYIAPNSENYGLLPTSTNPRSAASNQRTNLNGYGIASTQPVPEPPAVTEVNAGINPKSVNKVPLNIAAKTANSPTLPEAVKFAPIDPKIVIPADPDLPEAPKFSVVLGADCNEGCESSASTPRQNTKGNFLGSEENQSKQNINTILHYTWPNNTGAEKSYAFKMYKEGDTTNLPAPSSGNTYYFNSYNFGGTKEFANGVVASQGDNRNNQRFFIGGSRFWEIDNISSGTFEFPNGKKLNLGGILTLGLVSQENGTELKNSGTITDEEEKDEKWIKEMPYDPGKDYLTIKGPTEDYKVKRSGEGYVGYKVGIAQVQENGSNSYGGVNQKMTNSPTGKINFFGERSIGMYVYLPGSTTYAIMKNEGEINLRGSESYGMKIAAKSADRAEMVNTSTGKITLGKNGKDSASNSIAMALTADNTVANGVSLKRGNARNEGTITLKDVQNSIGTYVNVDSNITNTSTGKININSTIAKLTEAEKNAGKKQAFNMGMRADSHAGAEIINNGEITIDGSYAIGMLAKGSKLVNTKTISSTNVKNGIGIVGMNGATVENRGTVKVVGTGNTNNIGVLINSGSTGTVGTMAPGASAPSVEVSGDNSTGVLVTGAGSSLTLKGNVKVSGNSITGIVADGTNVKLEDDATVTVDDNGSEAGEIDKKGSYGIVVRGSAGKFEGTGTTVNAKVKTDKSIGLYSEGNLTVKKANITATDGAINFFAKDGKINITGGGTTVTGQKSLLFYTSGTGKVTLGGAMTSTIKGGTTPNTRGTAFYYVSPTRYGTFDKTAIQNYFNNTFGNGTSTLNNLTLNMEQGSRLFVASNVGMNLSDTAATNLMSGITNAPTINGSNYKTFMLYLSKLTINQPVDLNDSNSNYAQLEIANSSIDNANQMTGSQNRQVAMAQENGNDTSGNGYNPGEVTLTNTATGTINLTGEETTGIYAKRGIIRNEGTISVGKKSTAIYLVEDDRGPADGSKAANDATGTIKLGENSTGIFYKVNSAGTHTGTAGGVSNAGRIESTANNVTGISIDNPHSTARIFRNESSGVIDLQGQESTGIFATGTGTYEASNEGKINLASSTNINKPNIGMYTDKSSITLNNNGTITGGNKTVGIYGYNVNLGSTSVAKTGTGGTIVYSKGGNVVANGKLSVGEDGAEGANDAVGVYYVGQGGTVTSNASEINIGNSAYGFVIQNEHGAGVTLTTNTANVTLKNDSVYSYSNNRAGRVINNTVLNSTGNGNYGIYSAGTVTNNRDINFGTGIGNVGMYSIFGGTGTNNATITVGASDTAREKFGIGMAAGYKTRDSANIINSPTGVINVNGKNSIGMYATGASSTAINKGTINLRGENSVGMYLDNGATGINEGTITTVGSPKGAKGVVLSNNSKLINRAGAKININSAEGFGIFRVNSEETNITIANYGDITVSGGATASGKFDPTGGKELEKTAGGVTLKAPKGTTDVNITSKGKPVPNVEKITDPIGHRGNALISRLGMYVDTLRGTNPINGLEKLNVKKAELLYGVEAAQNSNSKYFEVSGKILKPYQDAVKKATGMKWSHNSASFTWMALPSVDGNGVPLKVGMAKIPYTEFAGKKPTPVEVTDTYNFLDGLEQRYDKNALESREKLLFNKLNGIGKNEAVLFYQAVDEMMGHQYANVQQRIYGTGRMIDKEISHLSKEWDTKSKQSNKIKLFGMRDEYNTDTAGVIDYTSNAYGIAYLHEDETVKLGNRSGWYAGAVYNRFKFKDIGRSEENQTMLKLGIFKTMSPVADHNGSLQWTISGEGYVSRNDMHRKYLVVDEIFNANSDYTTYGVAVKNELGYNIRTSERTSIRPYGSLKLEYGRFNTIKEKTGEVRLEVKGNDYYSVKPEVGVEFTYRQPMAVRTTFTAGLGLGYETELGQVGNVKNKGRVAYTDADWFNIRGEKDDRRGNFKADLNLGIENQRFGVTLNAGYDTKGKNIRGGLGLRVIY
ncbi:autotransporter-associated N-terminal domain-containing protein [Pseudoleptotrichia goodfellowii]|uniref:Autotransporter beta-domain protein n=1 Tax=Pseudoleptotrichia goodfellowii F0264 TaxID=596323 RepID=D0GPN5_9FUSO|nr:autotransporter-associated N-terminal domain-containing protein [Pseudoleptotrichia goodfellowii]EEY33946.1 autotransporter beta-domain protein [Pseudoleptotrichia goodfellowii F0264]